MAASGAEARIGQVVGGRYEIQGVIGSGGYGVVYRVVHRQLGKPQALKLLQLGEGDNQSRIERFEREARATCRIGHENIIDVTDFGYDPTHGHYFVMEYLDGESLVDVLRREGALPATRALRLVRQMAEGLGAAHAAGIVHRDLKPGNIQVLQRPRQPDLLKILDFGIAHFQGAQLAQLTRPGVILGSPTYVSPEQLRALPLDGRSDIYSLGVIFYELLVGRPPFVAATQLELLRMHLQDQPTPPSAVRPDRAIPTVVEAIVLRCLEKDAARRFQSAPEVARACEAAERALERSAAPAPADDYDELGSEDGEDVTVMDFSLGAAPAPLSAPSDLALGAAGPPAARPRASAAAPGAGPADLDEDTTGRVARSASAFGAFAPLDREPDADGDGDLPPDDDDVATVVDFGSSGLAAAVNRALAQGKSDGAAGAGLAPAPVGQRRGSAPPLPTPAGLPGVAAEYVPAGAAWAPPYPSPAPETARPAPAPPGGVKGYTRVLTAEPSAGAGIAAVGGPRPGPAALKIAFFVLLPATLLVLGLVLYLLLSGTI